MGKKTTKTSSTSAPPSWAVGPLSSGMNDIIDTVQGNAPALSSVESGITGSTIPGIQGQIAQQAQQLQPGYNYLGATMATNPGLANPANGMLKAYGNGNYLNENNAAVQQLAQFAGQQAGNQINSAFSSAGRTGSGNNVTDTARGVTQAELAPMLQNNQFEQGLQSQALGQLSGNYNTGIGAQSAAAGMLPGYSSSQFAGYSPLIGAQQLSGQLPYYGVNALSGLSGMSSGYGTQTGTQPGGWGTTLGGILGAGLGGWASGGFMMPSDRRLKTKIKLEFRAPDGLGWYSWNWKANPDGEREEGVIADEVEKLRPHAFVKGFVGGVYDGVNYAALGSVA